MSNVLRVFVIGAACGCVSGTTTDEGTTDDTTTPPTTEECEVFDLEMWCHNTENGGPDPAVPDCPEPSQTDLLAEQPDAWAGRCESPTAGTMTVVNQPTGYGGPFWYYDDTGHFAAFTYSTDINVYCDGAAFSVAYGFDPECDATCVYTDPMGVTGLAVCAP